MKIWEVERGDRKRGFGGPFHLWRGLHFKPTITTFNHFVLLTDIYHIFKISHKVISIQLDKNIRLIKIYTTGWFQTESGSKCTYDLRFRSESYFWPYSPKKAPLRAYSLLAHFDPIQIDHYGTWTLLDLLRQIVNSLIPKKSLPVRPLYE